MPQLRMNRPLEVLIGRLRMRTFSSNACRNGRSLGPNGHAFDLMVASTVSLPIPSSRIWQGPGPQSPYFL